ncbi:MAG: hypothetical protein ACI83I_000425 [Bacteroidia bacterium]|jgi:hypothetical protein
MTDFLLTPMSKDDFSKFIKDEIKNALNEVETASKTSDPIHTRKETKEMLKVSYVTLNSWDRSGLLKGLKIGGKVFYRHSDILAAMNRNNSTN